MEGVNPSFLSGHLRGGKPIVKPIHLWVGFLLLNDVMMERDDLQPGRNRSNIEILADILRLLRLGNTGKIQITHYAHLDGDQASNYIHNLVESGLLEGADEEMGLPSYRITEKGLAALNVIENIREMLPPKGTLDILHRSKIIDINPGRILMTRGVADLASDNQEFALFVRESLDRYRRGDWGNMSDEGRLLNNRFLEKNMRLFSTYGSERFPEIWITTEPDRSFSTIMFPDEEVSIEPLLPYEPGEDMKSRKVKKDT
jgi:predicted transcriptional regulator